MTDNDERRTYPRLHLSYPIQVGAAEPEGWRPEEHSITQDLSARGAYFCTYSEPPWTAGTAVAVTISVPHRLADGERDVTLDLRGRARVVRIERPARNVAGENGVPLSGVALEFEAPLSFRYAWV